MKRVKKTPDTPPVLASYVARNPCGTPNHTWKAFHPKSELHNHLLKDQRGICVYCEIDLALVSAEDRANDILSDLRVEHFHPQNEDGGVNDTWALEWTNLFACCLGGSEPKVVDPLRFAEKRAERSCDVPKKNNVWDDLILNPLQIPAFPPLFDYDDATGQLGCANSLRDQSQRKKIDRTLSLLHLNCERLKRRRIKTLDAVKDTIKNELSDNVTIDQAMSIVAQMLFSGENDWPPFFTAIRSYLGQAAEEQLHAINYNG